MWTNYLKIGLRNLIRDKVSALINIGGLAVGMAVALLISLWVFDEMSMNKNHENYEDLALVLQNQSFNGKMQTFPDIPRPLEGVLANTYGQHFKHLAMASWTGNYILTYEERFVSSTGNYIQEDFPEMISLQMIKGSRQGLKDPNSILLSASLAKAIFGEADPMDKLVKLGNQIQLRVRGVYEDLPAKSHFKRLKFIAPWKLFVKNNEWVQKSLTQWNNNSFQVFVQLNPGQDVDLISDKIKDIINQNNKDTGVSKSTLILHPMSKWHLYSKFEDGKISGGRIEYVRLYTLIAIFVLFLACINFINLYTARSEKRAKEVGVRKVIGSTRSQLVMQYLFEAFLVAGISFVFALLIVDLTLPYFNSFADKEMYILWTNPFFWLFSLLFIAITALLSGSYPAFYLSSFQPAKVLKSTFRAGRYATLPRKILVVVQFTVSIALVIGTLLVYQQIQHSKNRPVGYNRDRLIQVQKLTGDFYGKLDILKKELREKEAITEIAESSSPLTDIPSTSEGLSWPGMDPNQKVELGFFYVSHDFGKAVGWELSEGRDFSRDFAEENRAVILNEMAASFLGKEKVVGTPVKWGDEEFRVVGVIKNMLRLSPYENPFPSVYILNGKYTNYTHLKLNPNKPIPESIEIIKSVYSKLIPGAPFAYNFTDEDFARKFESEERVGQLSGIFAGLAILISCLGLFGLVNFVVEKRSKEIGIRKVLGASVLSMWLLLSRDFVILIGISSVLASLLAGYFLSSWLESFTYHTQLSWWMFAAASLGALAITLLTVSYQSIKAAALNPIEVLKDE